MKSYQDHRVCGRQTQGSFRNHGSLAAKQRKWRRPPRLLTRMLPVVLASLGVQAAPARAQISQLAPVTDGCMQNTSNNYGGPSNLNCTANDISITAVTIPFDLPPCVLGDPVTFGAKVEVKSTATSRYDIGVYLALDSGNALTGSCLISTLPYAPTNSNTKICTAPGVPFACCINPPSNTLSTCGYADLDGMGDTGRVCTCSTGALDPAHQKQPCNDNADCAVCVGGGTCPSSNVSGLQDLCGDIDGSAGGHNPVYYQIDNITLTCLDTDNDGFLDITACMSWDNQNGNGHLCRSPLAAFPNTPAKCHCQPALKIPITVPKTIQVCKDLLPSTDPGLFNLQIDGSSNYCEGNGTCTTGSGACTAGSGPCPASPAGTCHAATDVTDGSCTTNVCVGSGVCVGAACNHTVGETAGTGTSLSNYSTNISCFETAGHCTGNNSVICFASATCAAQIPSAGTCDLTPTKVANCTNCTSLSVTIPSNVASKIVCTITNNNCNDCNDCTTDSFNGITCVHTPVTAGTACIPQTGPVSGVCTSTQDTFACTNEACDSLGACITTPNDAKCNDGNECTFNDCNPGAVGAGADGCVYPPVAEQTPCTADTVPCTNDVCKSGTCQHIAKDSFCDDGASCTNPDLCAPGPGADADGCVYTPVDSKCHEVPDVLCTIDSCAPGAAGAGGDGCVHTTTPCADDNMYCNGTEYCDALGGCVHTGDPCLGTPTPVCCEVTDTCVPQCCSNADCPDDGTFCNGTEVCVAGVCGHTGNPCGPDNCSCTTDFCEEANDKCMHVPNNAFCNDNIFCNGLDYCAPGDLTADPVTCCKDPGNPCAPPLQCDEPNVKCNNCLPPPDTKCNDGEFCNGVETCVGGSCVDGPDPCVDPTPLNCAHRNCNEVTDVCVDKLTDSDCNDFIACTTDVCDPTNPLANAVTGCVYTPNNGFCNDMKECTNDSCVPTSCGSPPTPGCSGCVFAPKSAGFACGNQTPGGVCDNPDVCDAFGNCTQNAKPATTLCRSGGECDPPEFCDGTNKGCPDNACTPTGTACTDDGNECTDDRCDGLCHCIHPSKPDQTACSSDGNVCTKDVCKGGECAHPGEPTTTPCGNPTAKGDCDGPDHCNGMGGCDPNLKLPGTICRPAVNECDLTEGCTGTSPTCPPDGCQSGTTPCSSDGNECTRDVCNGVCDPTTVACTHPALPDGTFCGNPTSKGICDDPDECKGGVCTPQYEPSTTVCRPASNECDLEETCPGDGPDCSADVCVAAGTPCSSDSDKCTDDECNGSCSCTHSKNAVCGACCNRADVGGSCADQVPPQDCTGDPAQVRHYPGETCADVELDGRCPEHTGACCDEDTFGGCQVLPESQCNCLKCVFTKDTPCEEADCLHKAIPTMSQWGLAVLTLLLLIGAKVYFGRRQVDAA